MAGPHAPDLGRNAANHVALSPVSFLRRAADTWPGKVAVRHGDLAFTYAQFESRCRRLASALAASPGVPAEATAAEARILSGDDRPDPGLAL